MTANEPVPIRLASLADAPELASMHVASWRETYPGLIPDTLLASLSVERRTAMWQQIMGDPEKSGFTNVYVAEVNRKIIGFSACGAQRTEALREKGYDGEISAIYVLRAFQRRTIGARLLSILASDLLSRGYGGASLWVLRDNAPARRFYERYGAQIISEREEVRSDGTLVELAYGWTPLEEMLRGIS